MREIERMFTYHPPTAEDAQKYEMIRSAAKHLAEVIEQCVPHGQDRDVAICNVRAGVMFANAGIACRTRYNEDRPMGRACDASIKGQVEDRETETLRR